MVAFSLAYFGGQIPKVDDHYLPETNASLAQNTWLFSGAIEAIHGMREVKTLNDPSTRKVFRIPYTYYDKIHFLDAHWMEFDNPYVDVIRSPTINDSYERFYWASSKDWDVIPPQYNTKARILAGEPSLILGVPSPSVAPTITIGSTPNTGPTETRAYSYTWVTEYGEEGPPSAPTVATGYAANTWTIGITPPNTSENLNRRLDKVRIYRTVTSAAGVATFYFVAEVSKATTTFADNIASDIVGANQAMQSMYWTPPPDDLEGFVTMPNGIVASWRGNEIWFCEPYRPHAWPVQYQVSVEYPIVGLGVTGQSLIVLTTGYPTAIMGINPASMSMTRIATYQPCTSRGSILSSAEGVLYTSPNGIILAQGGSLINLTQDLVTKDEWMNLVDLSSVMAARINGAYYCWGSPKTGVFEPTAWEPTAIQIGDYTGTRSGAMIALRDAKVAYVTLQQDEPMVSVFEDIWTGEVVLVSDGKIYWLDPTQDSPRETYIWRSRIITMPNRRNLEAMRVWWNVPPGLSVTLGNPNTNLVQTFNPATQYGLVRVYADGRHVFTRELRTSGELIRLPSGFKATHWQVEVEGRVTIYQIEAATAAKELGSV